MAITIPDTILPRQTWINLYTATGITSGSQVVVFNKGSTPVLLLNSTTQPDNLSIGVNLLVDTNVIIASSTMGLWAYAENDLNGIVSVQTSNLDKQRQGALYVTSAHTLGMDHETAVALNLVAGARRVVALGNNPDIDTSTYPEDIFPGGGLYPWPTTATVMQVLSTDVNDTSSGTGARTIIIFGLDTNYNEITETVVLNGTSVVLTAQQFLRINNATIMSTGTNKVNIGNILIKNNTTPNNVVGFIQAGKGTSRSSNFTVPAGWTLMVNSVFMGINRPTQSTDASIATYFGSPLGFYRIALELSMSGQPYRHDVVPPIPVAEKFDFVLRGTYVSSSNADITGAWSGIMYQTSAITAL